MSIMSEIGPGWAGDLDPEHPYDVLVAIPSEHYFEYDEDSYHGKSFISRIVFQESSDIVLGANAMLGHNILFHEERNQIG